MILTLLIHSAFNMSPSLAVCSAFIMSGMGFPLVSGENNKQKADTSVDPPTRNDIRDG